MKAGAWYVAGFVVAFIYFYVYAVNYIRGVRADDEVQVRTDLKHLPEFLAQFSSSREGRDAEALWPLAMRGGPSNPDSNGPMINKKNLRVVRKRPIKVCYIFLKKKTQRNKRKLAKMALILIQSYR